MTLRSCLLVSAGAALAAWPATAQDAATPGERAALEALVAEALAHNPDLQALQEALVASRARPEQAKALPDPMVSVLYVNDGWAPSLGEQAMTTLGLHGQPDPALARQAGPARDDRDARRGPSGRAPRAATPHGRRGSAPRLLEPASWPRSRWESLREQDEVWKEAEGVARARYAVGQGAQQDVLRAQVEITRFEQLRAEQEAEIESRLAELSRSRRARRAA